MQNCVRVHLKRLNLPNDIQTLMFSFFENKKESCTGQDLADLGERLRDWFQLLQTNAKQNNNSKQAARVTAGAATTSGLSVYGRGLETFRHSG